MSEPEPPITASDLAICAAIVALCASPTLFATAPGMALVQALVSIFGALL